MNCVADALARARELRDFSDTPRLDVELLLGHVLQIDRGALRARPERELDAPQKAEFRRLLERRKRREPVAYLLGSAGFMDFELEVSPAVLIPRPETELLVELAIESLTPPLGESEPHGGSGGGNPVRIADLGTGSGAIAIALAIALARHDPAWSVLGIDISEEVLAVARRNAAALAGGNLRFRRGSWCEGLAPESFDLIVANPPYIAPGDPALHPDCAWEPPIALFAGADGLEAIREIAAQARRCLKPGGRLLLEHGFDQRSRVTELLTAAGYHDIEVFNDHAGHDRHVRARFPAHSAACYSAAGSPVF